MKFLTRVVSNAVFSSIVYWVCILLVCAAALFMGRSSATSAHLSRILVGISGNLAPFTFHNDQDEIAGFDVDLLNGIAQSNGWRIHYNNIIFSYMLSGVATRLHDIGTGCIFITPERQQIVGFSDPYYTMSLALVVRKDNEQIQSYRDINGSMTIAVVKGSKGEDFVRANTNANLIDSLSTPATLEQIANNEVDGLVVDDVAVYSYLQADGGTQFRLAGEPLAYYECGFAVHPENITLLRQINTALAEIKQNGEYEKLYARWFGDRPIAIIPPEPVADEPLVANETVIAPSSLLTSLAAVTGVYYLAAQTSPPSYELITLSPGGFWFSTSLTQTLVNSTTLPTLPSSLEAQLGTWRLSEQNRVEAAVVSLRQAVPADKTLGAAATTNQTKSTSGEHLLRKDYQLTIAAEGAVEGVYVTSSYALTQANSLILPTPGITETVVFTGYRVQK